MGYPKAAIPSNSVTGQNASGTTTSAAADTWRTLSTDGASPREEAVSVWTGTELLVWGGVTGGGGAHRGGALHSDGFAYNPTTDAWRAIAPAPVPGRFDAAAVWTGSRLLVWGGLDADRRALGRGASYDPATDTWMAMPLSPLRAVGGPTAVWTGTVLFVAGGQNNDTDAWILGQAATFDPATDAWHLLEDAPVATDDGLFDGMALTARWDAPAVWTGAQVLVVGGTVKSYQGADPGGYTYTPPR